MTEAEKERLALETCSEAARRVLEVHLGRCTTAQLAGLLGALFANLCIASEGSGRREAAERCADIAEKYGDTEIRDAISEAFGLEGW